MILLECPQTGERHLVRNAVGYAGWRLISRKAPRPPEHHEWCDETMRWLPNAESRQRAQRLAAIRDPEALLALLDAYDARIAALETLLLKS